MERIAFRRPQDPVPFVANANELINLHTGRLYRVLHCRLSGTLTIATAAATALKEDAPYSLMKKIEVMLNGQIPVKTISGKAILEKMILQKRVIPRFVAPGLTVANHAFSAYFQIPFWMPETGAFMDRTIIDSSEAAGVESFTLAVDWGTTTDLVTPDATTVLSWAVEPSIEIESMELVRFASEENKYLLNRERTITSPVTQTNDSHNIDLKSGPNRDIARILIMARDNDVRADDIVNKITVESDVDVRYKISGLMNKDIMDAEFEVETNRTGVYLVDLAPGALIGHAADMNSVSDFQLTLDVTGGANHKLEVLVQEIIRGSIDQLG